MLAAKWNNKAIDFNFDSEEVFLEGNEELLKQVWINIMDNAIKFSPDQQTLLISIKYYDNWAAFSFSNISEELSSDKMEHLFDKFYQGDTSHTTKDNGLGLTIVKKIIELHKGSINVELNKKMTTFSIMLPLA